MKQVRKLYEQAQGDQAGFEAALLDEREIRFLPPIHNADKFLCVGKNYGRTSRSSGATTCSPRRRRSRPPSSAQLISLRAQRPRRAPRRRCCPGLTSRSWCSSSAKRALGAKKKDALGLRRRRHHPQRPHRPRHAEARGRLGLALLTGKNIPASDRSGRRSSRWTRSPIPTTCGWCAP